MDSGFAPQCFYSPVFPASVWDDPLGENPIPIRLRLIPRKL